MNEIGDAKIDNVPVLFKGFECDFYESCAFY